MGGGGEGGCDRELGDTSEDGADGGGDGGPAAAAAAAALANLRLCPGSAAAR